MKTLPELRIILGKTLDQIDKFQKKFLWKEENSLYYNRQLSSLYVQADILAGKIIKEEKKRGKPLYEKKKKRSNYLNRRMLQERFIQKELAEKGIKV